MSNATPADVSAPTLRGGIFFTKPKNLGRAGRDCGRSRRAPARVGGGAAQADAQADEVDQQRGRRYPRSRASAVRGGRTGRGRDREGRRLGPIFMARIVMAYIGMASIVMASIVMAYIVIALYSYGLYSYGL